MEYKKVIVTKTKVPVRTHSLTATWTINPEDEPSWEDVPVDIANLTMEEQADLIIKRLSTPPKDTRLEEELMHKIAQAIADEIDTEILKGLK